MQKTTVKIIKLINGDDIVAVLPTGDKQLPDNGPLIRLDKPLQIKYVPQITNIGIKDYIATLGDEGPAYANRFEVIINPSQSGRMGNGLTEKCALFCEEVQIPGAILSNKELNIGPWTFFRNTKLGFLGNEINFTFMTTNNWQLRGEFEGWISDCVNANSQEVAYLDDISCTVDIFCLNTKDEVTKKLA